MRHWCFLALATTIACAPADPAESPRAADDPQVNLVSGTLLIADGALQFAPCGGTAAFPIIDLGNGEAAALLNDLAPADLRVTAVIRLAADSVRAIRYAAPEGPGCESLPPDADIEARGQEPFWYVRVSRDSMTLRTPEAIDGITWTDGSWTTMSATHRRFAVENGADTVSLDIRIEPCADGMSGARYPFRAVLTRGGDSSSGCALDGIREEP